MGRTCSTRNIRILTIVEQLLIGRLFPRDKTLAKVARIGCRHGKSTERFTREYQFLVSRLCCKETSCLYLLLVLWVTFIGKGRLPKDWLRSTFRVRRLVVARALQWLKMNNLKYYSDVEIDMLRLEQLPEDDYPSKSLASFVNLKTSAWWCAKATVTFREKMLQT